MPCTPTALRLLPTLRPPHLSHATVHPAHPLAAPALGHFRPPCGSAGPRGRPGSRIVLECAEGRSTREISCRLRVVPDTVRPRRRRFLGHGLDGLADEPRPGVPWKITDADVERVIVKALEEKQKNATPVDQVDGGSARQGADPSRLAATGVHAAGRCGVSRFPPRSGLVRLLGRCR
ncbi:helix-turn-helix domain-containing protein [Streptomyces sp. NPDC021749]|uniref:helix-turn-helix domain-containing protein n=1 Tax=Streptomyces sp. NPDC021749 TaxID=3154905 RepID=UPI003409FA47